MLEGRKFNETLKNLNNMRTRSNIHIEIYLNIDNSLNFGI